MRQKHQGGAETVIRSLIDEAAERGHEAAQLAARLMKDTGRAPALRAGHDGVVAEIAAHAAELAGNEIERLVPRHRHEALAAAADAIAGAALAPALAHHRLRHPQLGMHRRRHRLDPRRGFRVVLERPHADDLAVLDLGQKRAPMRMMADELGHGMCLVGPESLSTAVPRCACGLNRIYKDYDHARAERLSRPHRPRHADGRLDAALLDSGAAGGGNS